MIGVPEGYPAITPHLTIKGCAKAIDFYKQAFGAEELHRMPGPDGQTVMHAELRIGNSPIMVNDEFPDFGSLGPDTVGGTSVQLHLYVPDADKAFKRATDAGAKVLMPLSDTFWGDRYGVVQDPFGHKWGIAHQIEVLSPEQIAQNAAKAFENCGG